MALSPTSSHGGGAGAAFPTQTGSGNPITGNVTPTAKGAVYTDSDNGGLFIATGATAASWVQVGGNTTAGAAAGVNVRGPTGAISVEAGEGLSVALRDLGADAGTGNGIYWNYSGGADGAQDAAIQVGSTGQYTLDLLASGVLDATATKGVKLPTADPHVAGALWNNAGTPAISAG